MRDFLKRTIALSLVLLLLAGCGQPTVSSGGSDPDSSASGQTDPGPSTEGPKNNSDAQASGGAQLSDETQVPDDAQFPDNAETHDDTQVPDDTQTPDNTQDPDDTQTPDNTQASDNTQSPEQPNSGESSQAPETGGDTQTGTTPETPEAPETSTPPEDETPPAQPSTPEAPQDPPAPVNPPAPEESEPLPEVPEEVEDAYVDKVEVPCEDIEDETVALSNSVPALPNYLTVSAPGTQEKRNSKAVIDYSNMTDGYVMVQYTASTTKRIKAVVKGPTTQYQYNLVVGTWASLPLSDGNGKYQITIYENVKDSAYANVVSVSVDVTLVDEFAPFLRSNQYVDFEAAPNTIAKAAELCDSIEEPLKKVEAVYSYVVKNMTYDKELASTVTTGYLPVLDTVLEKKSGICFDYAALMTGMLRSQCVPCKLVVGYAGSAYHAWINVWSKDTGWVDGVIFFDGTAWQRMDPTFASSQSQSADIMAFIGDGSNYTAKLFY